MPGSSGSFQAQGWMRHREYIFRVEGSTREDAWLVGLLLALGEQRGRSKYNYLRWPEGLVREEIFELDL